MWARMRMRRQQSLLVRRVARLFSQKSSAVSSVFVHNLSYDVKSEALMRHMRKAGSVLSVHINTNKKKKSKGTAVVTYETEEEATNAIEMLQGSLLYGRMLMIREDRSPLIEREVTKSEVPLSGTEDEEAMSVFVGNINTNVTSAELKRHMEIVGPVENATLFTGHMGDSRGCGIVVYKRSSDALRACEELYNSVLNGRPIFVREDRETDSEKSPSERPIPQKRTCVLLGNVDKSMKMTESMHSFMSVAGNIKKIHIDAKLDGKGKGKILIEYETAAAALRAIAMLHGKKLGHKKVTVQKYGN